MCSGLVAAAAGAFLLKLVTWMLVKLLLSLITRHRAPAAAAAATRGSGQVGRGLIRQTVFIYTNTSIHNYPLIIGYITDTRQAKYVRLGSKDFIFHYKAYTITPSPLAEEPNVSPASGAVFRWDVERYVTNTENKGDGNNAVCRM